MKPVVCYVCHQPVEMKDNAVFIEALLTGDMDMIGDTDPQHVRCTPSRAQYVTDPAFGEPVVCEGGQDKRRLSATIRQAREVQYTAVWQKVQAMAQDATQVAFYNVYYAENDAEIESIIRATGDAEAIAALEADLADQQQADQDAQAVEFKDAGDQADDVEQALKDLGLKVAGREPEGGGDFMSQLLAAIMGTGTSSGMDIEPEDCSNCDAREDCPMRAEMEQRRAEWLARHAN